MEVKVTGEFGSQQIEFTHEYGRARAIELPHLSQAVFIYDSYVNYGDQGKGFGSKYHKERLDWLKAQGYVAAICSVWKYNGRELSIMHKYGWTSVMVGDMYFCTKEL